MSCALDCHLPLWLPLPWLSTAWSHSPNVAFAEVFSWPPKSLPPTSTPISNTACNTTLTLPITSSRFSIPRAIIHPVGRLGSTCGPPSPLSGLPPLTLYSVASPDGSCFAVSLPLWPLFSSPPGVRRAHLSLFLAPCLSLPQPNPLHPGPQLISGMYPPVHSIPSSSIQGLYNFLPSTHLPRLINPSEELRIPQTLLPQLRSFPWPGGSLTSSLPTETLPILQGLAQVSVEPSMVSPAWRALPSLRALLCTEVRHNSA